MTCKPKDLLHRKPRLVWIAIRKAKVRARLELWLLNTFDGRHTDVHVPHILTTISTETKMSARQNECVSHITHADDTFQSSLFKFILFFLLKVKYCKLSLY